MACVYNLKIGERVIQLPSRISSNEEIDLESFFQDLKASGQGMIDSIMEAIEQAQIEENAVITPISDIDRKAAFEQVQDHLSKIGVQMEIVNQQEMERLGFPSNTKAGVLEGVIYVNKDQATIASPMHEFLHLVFGVMKSEDFSTYQNIMNRMMSVKGFVDKFSNLPTEYKSFMELDQQEETFVRYFEDLLENKIPFDDIAEDYDYINKKLSQFIAKTFDIPKVVDTLDFLKSPFANLTKQGSGLFIRNSHKTTGYLQKRQKVIQSAKIMNYVKELIENGIIEKGPCE